MFRPFKFIAEGFKGFFRNGLMSFASIFVLFSSLFLIGVFATVIQNVNYNLDEMQDFKELVCYMELDATEEQRIKAEEEIKTFSNVTKVTFVSKEEALKQEKAKYDSEEYKHLFDMYDNGRANPLPDSIRVEYESVSGFPTLEEKLKRVDGNEPNISNRIEIAQNIEKLKKIITIGGTWLMALLVVVSVFVIANTIKITYHSRELEISIMRYIGATKFYITMPFVVESLIISAVAALVGYAAQWYLYVYFIEKIAVDYPIIKIMPFAQMNNMFLIIYFAAGLFIGMFGSIITIRKYMKV